MHYSVSVPVWGVRRKLINGAELTFSGFCPRVGREEKAKKSFALSLNLARFCPRVGREEKVIVVGEKIKTGAGFCPRVGREEKGTSNCRDN